MIEYLELIIKLDYDWANEPDEVAIYGQSKCDHPAYQYLQYDGNDDTFEDEYETTSHSLETWLDQFLYDTKSVAVATQTHQHTATCRKKGTPCCFGFMGEGKPLSAHTSINLEKAEITLKRNNALTNNHNPLISAVTRSNHDLKFTFLSGLKSLKPMYYMTMYVSKCEDDVSDAVIMNSAWKGLQCQGVLPTSDDRERLRRLIIHLTYLQQCSLQFSAAQVAVMLLGIGNEGTHYTNWTFSKVNLYPFINYFHSLDNGHSRVVLSHMDVEMDSGSEDSEEEGLWDEELDDSAIDVQQGGDIGT